MSSKYCLIGNTLPLLASSCGVTSTNSLFQVLSSSCALHVLGVDARVPVELLDDALGLHLRAGRHLDELLRRFHVGGLRRDHVVHRLARHARPDELQAHVGRQLAVGHPGVEHVDPHRAHRDLAAVQHVERAGIARRDHHVAVEFLQLGRARRPISPWSRRRTGGGVHNIRVFNNRGVNAAHGGYSSQPVFGGPAYFFRNILYHVPSGVAFKFSAKPAGLYAWHNTIIGEHIVSDSPANMHFLNNLFLGRDTPNRGILRLGNATDAWSSDYNGYRPNRDVKDQYLILAPKPGQRIYEPKKEDWQSFATLASLQKAIGQETHSIEVDFDIFERMTPPDPTKRHAVYHAMDLNFRLKPNGRAVDAGARIPSVNDDFTGRAPDLGALEAGKPEPHYGPRWLTWQPFYR